MQIYKTNTLKAVTTPSTAPDPEVQQQVEDFFNEETSAEEAPLPSNPFDLLFSGIPSAGQADPFAPAKVVTLQDILIANPDARRYLDKIILKYESIRDQRFTARLEHFKKAIAEGKMSAKEIGQIQKTSTEIEQAIAKINGEIEKAKEMQETQKETFYQELSLMTDLNSDGYVGNPSDKENSYRVAKHPLTDQTVLLDHNGKPAGAPLIDSQYLPALASTHNLVIADSPDPAGKMNYDTALKLNGYNPSGYQDSTFGAQIDIAAPEGFWVKKDPKTGDPIFENDPQTRASHYQVKPLEIIQREDGKEMIGQKPPATEEKAQWTFVRVTDLDITSEFLDATKPEKGGFVFYDFKYKGDTILRLRIEGFSTEGLSAQEKSRVQHLLPDAASNYVAATTVGIAVNGGEGKHSTRYRPLNVDASGFHSTGKVSLGANSQAFWDQIGLDKNFAQNLPHRGASAEDLKKAPGAIQESLYGPFFHPFGMQGALYVNDSKDRTGLSTRGIRGVIQGTDYNDLIVVPAPADKERLKEFLPIGIAEIPQDHPAYATVVYGGSGRNAVISKGGDIFASGVNFFWRESGESGDQREDAVVVVKTNNYIDSKKKSPKVFVHIGDNKAGVVAVDNGTDAKDDKPENVEGTPDDWFNLPNGTSLTNVLETADLPDWVNQNADPADPAEIRNRIDAARSKIISDAIEMDPLSAVGDKEIEWETYGKQYDEWDKVAGSFFAEWEFFNGEISEGGEGEEI